MRGRDLFDLAHPALTALSALLHLLPRVVVRSLWSWLDGVPGMLGTGLRYAMASRLADCIGRCVYFGEYIEIRHWENLRIGSNVSIHRLCYLDALGGISIGNDVSIAHSASILSFEHTWEDASRPIRDNPLVSGAVSIEDDVWIGCAARILAGVHLRKRTVVAAGAVVTATFGGNALLAGVPARCVRSLGSRDPT